MPDKIYLILRSSVDKAHFIGDVVRIIRKKCVLFFRVEALGYNREEGYYWHRCIKVKEYEEKSRCLTKT